MELLENLLLLVGGLALFLFGMSILSESLERQAGSRLGDILGKLSSTRIRGLFLGLFVTAVIQSSSAATVMAVGFVSSGLLSLSNVTGIIMGANIGTTVTAWLVSLTQIEGTNIILKLLKPSSFAPILGMVGIILYLSKKEKGKNIGAALLGFTVLMFGMETMTNAAKPLSDFPAFRNAFAAISNPFLALLTGTVLTAILQSSSASVGILQALSAGGAITLGTAIPIVMGQNIGTCVTTLIASVGASREAKRAAIIHLYFNLLGTALLLTVFLLLKWLIGLSFTDETATPFSIAMSHTLFNVISTIILFPCGRSLESLAIKSVKENEAEKT
jgi:phosphate:Na+ symporter